MKVYYSEDSVLHSPSFYFRRGRQIAHFEQAERFTVMRAAVEKAGHDLCAALTFDEEAVIRVHSARYVEFLRTAYVRRAEIEPGLDYVLPSHFARLEMHQYPNGMIGRVGFHMADLSTPIHEKTFQAVLGSVNSALSAANDVVANGGSAYALCRPPGHHASRESAGGFCYINNTAVAAAHLQACLQARVGVIDIDVHHGNGTQSIFYERNDVVTASVHANPSTFMPYYAGYADEHGAGLGLGFNLNLPLPHGTTDVLYLAAIDEAIAFQAKHGITGLVVALGLDASEDDPNGAMKVTTDGFRAAGERFGATHYPVVLVQEGGYLSDILGRNLCAFIEGFEQARSAAKA